MAVITGTLTGEFNGVGESDHVFISNTVFNVSLSGFGDATIVCERSFDAGVTWFEVRTWTRNRAFEGNGVETEKGVLYRLRCTQYVTGPIKYRIGTTTAKLSLS